MSKIDLTNLNKVDTELVLPSTSENINLQKLQENKWGNILNNQTFNTLNNNIKLLKNSLVETINTLNNENIIAKNKYINEDNDVISLGDSTKKLNFTTTQIQVNGVDTEFLTSQSLSNISNIAYKDKENTFIYPLNTNQYNINNNQVINDDNDNINIGNNQRKINLQSSDGKLYLNGKEFKSNIQENINEYDKITTKYSISEYSKKINIRLDKDLDINKLNSYMREITFPERLSYRWSAYNAFTESSSSIYVNSTKFIEVEGNNNEDIKNKFNDYFTEADSKGLYGSPNVAQILVDTRYSNSFIDFLIPILDKNFEEIDIKNNKISSIYLPRVLKKYSIKAESSHFIDPFNISFYMDLRTSIYLNKKRILDYEKNYYTYTIKDFDENKDYSDLKNFFNYFSTNIEFKYDNKDITISPILSYYIDNNNKVRGYIKVRTQNLIDLNTINLYKQNNTDKLGFYITFKLRKIKIERVISYLEDLI